MPAITPTVTMVDVQPSQPGSVMRVKWTGIDNANTGAPIAIPPFAILTVQVFGTFGAGGVATIQGTLEDTPTNWATLNSEMGTALALSTAQVLGIKEKVSGIRPSVAGDDTTALTVIVLIYY